MEFVALFYFKSGKRSIFVTDSYLKGKTRQQLKGMQSFCLSIEGIRKDYLFREKWYVKQGKGLDLGAGPPHTKIC